ncbi:MAG: hypothetical protein PHV43_01065 [Candidatus Colwellbacteria bacterium]|nr:hypothetical protein [Candidatus Colwellbacteria bacterium]
MDKNISLGSKNLRLISRSSYNPIGSLENLRSLIDKRIEVLKAADPTVGRTGINDGK